MLGLTDNEDLDRSEYIHRVPNRVEASLIWTQVKFSSPARPRLEERQQGLGGRAVRVGVCNAPVELRALGRCEGAARHGVRRDREVVQQEALDEIGLEKPKAPAGVDECAEAGRDARLAAVCGAGAVGRDVCSQKRSSQSRGNSQRPKPTVSALTTDGVLCGVRVIVPSAAA